jgi:cardiolipin synthase
LRHIPNILTFLRLALLPFILIELSAGRRGTGLPLLIFSGSTDAIDGWLARRFHWESKLGAILDPIADKLLLVSLFLALGIDGSIPWWLVSIVLGRDVLLLIGAACLFRRLNLKKFPPSKAGKLSTIIQGITVLAVLFHVWPWPFFIATAAITIISGGHYVWRTSKLIQAR